MNDVNRAFFAYINEHKKNCLHSYEISIEISF